MIIFKKPEELKDFVGKQRAKHEVGFVPTMGALHDGHLSLLHQAKKENGLTVCSIFVNPTQFNDPEDFKKYPVTMEKDVIMLHDASCDVLFIPSVVDVYPKGIDGLRHYELGFLETVLEGKYRPGHFQGVCQVMHRLLEIVLPDNLYLGQKDYQQCMVIKKLIELIGLDQKIHLKVCPTLREIDGLAMSSRNTRLNADERIKATNIATALRMIKENIRPGNTEQLTKRAAEMLLLNGFRVDYLEIANADTLQLIEAWDGKEKIVAVVAAFLNKVRLIDNLVINP